MSPTPEIETIEESGRRPLRLRRAGAQTLQRVLKRADVQWQITGALDMAAYLRRRIDASQDDYVTAVISPAGFLVLLNALKLTRPTGMAEIVEDLRLTVRANGPQS